MKEKPESLIRYVIQSRTRTNVLLAISSEQHPAQALLEQGSASESAVYNALSNLENHGLIHHPRPNQWYLTGTGSIVVDFLGRQQGMDELIKTDRKYWQSHDVTVLPHSFQLNLPELVPGSVIRATETQPSRAIREVESRFEATTSANVVAPIYDERYWSALLDDCESYRFVIAPTVLSNLPDDVSLPSESIENLNIRATDISFELAITDDCLLLSLPLLDGSYDVQTEFIAETEQAINWGTNLFEQIWAGTVHIDDYSGSFRTNSKS